MPLTVDRKNRAELVVIMSKEIIILLTNDHLLRRCFATFAISADDNHTSILTIDFRKRSKCQAHTSEASHSTWVKQKQSAQDEHQKLFAGVEVAFEYGKEVQSCHVDDDNLKEASDDVSDENIR